jgi:hypothetical protein
VIDVHGSIRSDIDAAENAERALEYERSMLKSHSD